MKDVFEVQDEIARSIAEALRITLTPQEQEALAAKPTRICRHTISICGAAATRALEGQRVRVYNVAKTIADLFKYRKKIGLEVALEALREVWRGRRVTIDEIDHYARICRVERVMRPYLEALTA